MAKAERKKLGTYLEMLPVKLNDEEVLDRAKKASSVHDELARHLLEAASFKNKLKAKEGELQEDFERLMHAVGTGTEPREVEVEAWADYSKERFFEVRVDTGKTISERPLREEERQGEFDLESWQQELHLRVVRTQEDIAKRRAGDVDKEEK
jgi:hypothetical protein